MNKRLLVLVLLCVFVFSMALFAKEKIEFESVLTDAQYHYVAWHEDTYQSLWTLKFENGAVIAIVQDTIVDARETIWFIGKKYRVQQKSVLVGYKFKVELMELTGFVEVDKKVQKQLEKQKKKK